LLLVSGATLALAGCPAPVTTMDDGGTNDAHVAVDTGVVRDTGNDTGIAPHDAGPPPLCTGAGCDIVDLEMQSESSCILRANGQVDCWGRGQEGELGDNAMRHSDDCRLTAGEASVDCSRSAITVLLPGPADSITSRGTDSVCAILRTSHEVWCWGGQHYRLGSNLEHSRLQPEHLVIDATPLADGTADLAMSYGNVCWIAPDTSVRCLGSGGSGRLGNGTFMDTATPVTALGPDGTTPLMGVLEIDTSSGHTCARTADHLYCWGNNHYLQLGAPPTHMTCIATPTMYDCTNIAIEVTGVDATTIVDLELGDTFTCVRHSTGHVQCWGGGQSGGLGTGDINTTSDPVEPAGLSNVDELSVVDGNACALLHDGTVSCWGPANLGQVGDGSMVHAATPCVDGSGNPYDCQLTPTQVMGLSGVEHISLGAGHACALTTTDEVWCWGYSLRYQLGDMMRAMPAFAPVRATAISP
jgi:alpha-tubulin suppressor-like RCC1 family protein